MDQNLIPEISKECGSDGTDELCELKGRSLCETEDIYCTGATGLSGATSFGAGILVIIFATIFNV